MAGSGIFSRNVIPLSLDGEAVGLDNARWQGPAPQLPERQGRLTETDVIVKRHEDRPRSQLSAITTTEQRHIGKERRVGIISVQAAGAGTTACNGHFRYECLHQGKPLFKAESGAIVYFNRHWKMNNVYKTTGWLYSVPDAKGQLPPEGQWAPVGSSEETAGPVPKLCLEDEALKHLGGEGSVLLLEQGRTVLNRDENKTWRWVDVPVFSDIEIIPTASVEKKEPEAQKDHKGYRWKKQQTSPSPMEESVEDPPIPSLEALLESLDAAQDVDSPRVGRAGCSEAFGYRADAAEEPSPPWPMQQPALGLAERLNLSAARHARGRGGNLLRARRSG